MKKNPFAERHQEFETRETSSASSSWSQDGEARNPKTRPALRPMVSETFGLSAEVIDWKRLSTTTSK